MRTRMLMSRAASAAVDESTLETAEKPRKPMKFQVGAWAAAVVLVGFATIAPAQEIKIGYVDLQRALNECEAGKKAKEDFKRQVDRLQSDLEKQKSQIESLREQLEKKALVMKEDERRNLENDYRKKLRDFERNYKDSQGELQGKDNELTAEILKQLQKVIQGFGAREGYTLILENSSSTVLYSNQNADLTDQVIQEFNASKGK